MGDTDSDGLENGREIIHRTNVSDPDTDEDGLPDGVEVKLDDALPKSDPLRKDVYVEVDHLERCGLNESTVAEIEETFESAPVSNPDGSRGIDLHISMDDSVPQSESIGSGFFWLNEKFDHRLEGYHYLVGTFAVGESAGTVGTFNCADPVVFVHELGHSLGLDSYRGIDSSYVPFQQYRSVMNYNSPPGFRNYSDGSHGKADYDDWGFIEDHMNTPPVTKLCERVDASSPQCDRKIPIR